MALLLGVAAARSFAGEPWLPGGEEVKKAVEARRGKTELSRLAASMKPGTWAGLKTEVPPRLWTSPPPSRGLSISGWTDDAHWDSRTGQFLYMGLRQTRQFVAYSETNNAWRVIPLDPKSDNPVFQTKYGHVYSSNGFDHERSRFYHCYRDFTDEKAGVEFKGGNSFFDTVTEKWTRLPGGRGGAMSIEYFGAMDGLVILGKDPIFFSNERQQWEKLGASPVDGYHSLFRHNPYRNEVLMAGGNNNIRVVARLKKDGKIERLKDFPVDIRVQSDKVTIDPATGRYLILGGDQAPKQLYEFDSDKNEYRLVEGFMAQWPYKRGDMPVCAFIPEYGVVMWAYGGGVFLYKHDPGIAYPLAPDTPPAAETAKKPAPPPAA
jgi:hypothetical protein